MVTLGPETTGVKRRATMSAVGEFARASAASGATPQRLTYLVKQFQEALRIRLDAITQQFDLTPKQYTALSVLATNPGMSAAALARITFVTPQAANEMVAALERKGFLLRSVDERNRRCLEVRLSRKGHRALARCNELVDELEAEVFRGVDAAERARFRRMLNRCVTVLGADASG
jgi:DNA-binding MarR family transcriptional regulator